MPPAPGRGGAAREVEFTLRRRELYAGRVWVVDDFLSAAECAAWISYGEGENFERVHHPESWDTAHRDNGRVEFHDANVAAQIWARLQAMLPEGVHPGVAVGCYGKIRLYRYTTGQRFGKHIDESNSVSRRQCTGATVLIYLNDDVKGGETVFYVDHAGRRIATSFTPLRGALLFHGFVSQIFQITKYSATNCYSLIWMHRHGERCLTHEAIEVLDGAKYVLRTDVVYSAR